MPTSPTCSQVRPKRRRTLIPTRSRHNVILGLRSNPVLICRAFSLSPPLLFFLRFFLFVYGGPRAPSPSLLRLRAVENRPTASATTPLAVRLLLYRRLVWPSRVTMTNGTRRSASRALLPSYCARVARQKPSRVGARAAVGRLLTGILMEDPPTARAPTVG